MLKLSQVMKKIWKLIPVKLIKKFRMRSLNTSQQELLSIWELLKQVITFPILTFKEDKRMKNLQNGYKPRMKNGLNSMILKLSSTCSEALKKIALEDRCKHLEYQIQKPITITLRMHTCSYMRSAESRRLRLLSLRKQ